MRAPAIMARWKHTPARGGNRDETPEQGQSQRSENEQGLPRDEKKPENPVTARDEMLREKLLDRDGGSHAVGIVDGKYEGGYGKETQKQVFRLI